MADKEATVYIVDVGLSMGRKHNGRKQSDLDWAMEYVWDKITSTVALERKTATLGVIGLRTTGTANELGDEESFEHISVFQEISQILLPDLQNLRQKIKLSNTDEGDAISAIVIAIQMITRYTKKLKYRRKIVLVTDGHGSLDADGVSEITKKIKQDTMELVILGVDFDDPEYGYKEEDKDSGKASNEETLKALAEGCDGVFGTLAQAIEELGIPRLKATRPVQSYKGQLTLGDPMQYETAMCIDVERYPRTAIRRPPSASQFVQRSDLSNGHGSTQSSATIRGDGDGGESSAAMLNPNGLTSVKNARTYQVIDEEAPGGKRDVERDELAKGYEYGRTAVHISETDENVTKLETQAGLEFIGFVPWSSYGRYMSMSVSCVIIAQKSNDKAIMALSSVIHALFELESYGIARLVSKTDKAPVIVLLAPSIEVDYECLLDVQLPFAEDVRHYKFPPLDRVLTVSGKVLKEHRNLPTDALQTAMSDYVDRMDLSTFGKDDKGNPTEYMPMEETFSPVLHRVDQAIRWRAVHPDEPVPPPYEILTRFSKQPEELQVKAKRYLEKLVAAAEVKKVPPKLQGRKRQRDQMKPLSGLNIDELLGREKKAKISRENAIPEFKRMLESSQDLNAIQDASKQMATIIEAQITDSFGDIAYGQVIEELGVLRQELTELEEPGIYNDFVRALKEKLLAGKLGGERREMWWEIRKNRLGLIEKGDGGGRSPVSNITEEEAKQFLTSK
ncbi:ku family dna [Lasallia pustulata]|uniref:ATP-dependent DNA helicase II subunit 2 n=1 Tax=Lasallia pustulata TaxID=136370 RepID=A0A1W5D2G7_9LECA|nr:ku family dna [Lasallia pustulata]